MFICPFCNEQDVPRFTGSLLCMQCENIRDMVRMVPKEGRVKLQEDLLYAAELRACREFAHSELAVWEEMEEDPEYILWLVYFNINKTAVAVEAFKKYGDTLGYTCTMMVAEAAEQFIDDPCWEEYFEEGLLTEKDKQHFLEILKDLFDP